MAKVEAVAYISRVPEELMELIREGDYKLTRRRGEKYVREGYMREEILNLLIGSACMTKAKEISQEIKEKKGEASPELELIKDNLSYWGAAIIFENLHRLSTS